MSTVPPATPSSGDGLAWPRDFESRHGAGLDLGVALGGGGLFLVAWNIAYLYELAEHGIDLRTADRLVGTSAGSVMATGLAAGRLGRLHATVALLDRSPAFIGRLAPSGELKASQQRALDLFLTMADGEPETVRRIGHAALAASTPSAASMSRTIGAFLGVRRWPAANLHVTCMDTFTGERCVVTAAAKVGPARAVAASSAIPGVFSPQPIRDRRCMDGGVSWSGVHLDVVAGARKAVVLVLPPSIDAADGGLGSATDLRGEVDALRSAGTEVFLRSPESVDRTRLMDPTAVSEAFEMGHRQARDDAEELQAFLA